MRKLLIYTALLLFGLLNANAQQPTDSVKKVSIDSISAYSKLNADQIFELERAKIEAHNVGINSQPWNNEVLILYP